ncbi:hypothetical protein GMRT_12669 [Giardia muris]|uniref:Uncharacterized protein n=1 Tax=Giardia muris TaxID=5742 RepID=A0A4Z1T5W8_GIAMU|nr:hypothetical protein GMRT_12669 [Giardia muris]|eukprot:TNJ27861.1 hypothetical protein GMRT_12669 [Giardia muris]
MKSKPEQFQLSMTHRGTDEYIRRVIAPSLSRLMQGEPLEGGGSRPETYSVGVQTDPLEPAFDPISIFYDSIQSAPSAREITARVRAECTAEHRRALEHALQTLTAEHKLAISSLTSVLNAERSARAADRERFEVDRKAIEAERQHLRALEAEQQHRGEELQRQQKVLEQRLAELDKVTSAITAKEGVIVDLQATIKHQEEQLRSLAAEVQKANGEKQRAEEDGSVLQRRIISLEETLKLYESVARYYSTYGIGQSQPPLPPSLPFPPTSDSRPTGYFRHLQHMPPNYPLFNGYGPPPYEAVQSESLQYESLGTEHDHSQASYVDVSDIGYPQRPPLCSMPPGSWYSSGQYWQPPPAQQAVQQSRRLKPQKIPARTSRPSMDDVPPQDRMLQRNKHPILPSRSPPKTIAQSGVEPFEKFSDSAPEVSPVVEPSGTTETGMIGVGTGIQEDRSRRSVDEYHCSMTFNESMASEATPNSQRQQLPRQSVGSPFVQIKKTLVTETSSPPRQSTEKGRGSSQGTAPFTIPVTPAVNATTEYSYAPDFEEFEESRGVSLNRASQHGGGSTEGSIQLDIGLEPLNIDFGDI